MSTQLAKLAADVTKREELKLETLAGEIKLHATTYCQRAEGRLDVMREQLHALIERRLERERNRLEVAERSIEALSPKRIMQLGFAVVRSGGKALTSVGSAQKGDEVEIELMDGTIKARVE